MYEHNTCLLKVSVFVLNEYKIYHKHWMLCEKNMYIMISMKIV